MHDPRYEELRQLAWRRPLSDAERAEAAALLATHPDLREDWQFETSLNRGLGRLPDVPVSSNFTTLVMQAVERDSAQSASVTPRQRGRNWLDWLPKAAVATLVLGLSFWSYTQFRTSHRIELAETVATVSTMVPVPDPAIWEDFETINRLDELSPRADGELLALFK